MPRPPRLMRSELAELRKLLCTKLEPYFTEGKVQGVKVSLASSLAPSHR